MPVESMERKGLDEPETHTGWVISQVFPQNPTWLSKHFLPLASDKKSCHAKSCHAASMPPAWKATIPEGSSVLQGAK